MQQFYSLLQSILLLISLVLSVIWLKKRSVVSDEHRAAFGRLVTDFALPPVIFANLARQPFRLESMLPALLMFVSISTALLLGWIIGKTLKLDRAVLGSFVLVAGFGSSSTLGYSLVQQVFGSNPAVMSDTLIIGEFGACLPAFTLGVAIAMYFGMGGSEQASVWSATKPFFRSPIFISLALGLAASVLNLPPENPLLRFAYRVMDVVGGSLVVLVAITVGLMLKPIPYKTMLALIGVVAVLKLILEPVLSGSLARVLGVPAIEREVLVLEAAMPSGTVAAVLAARYGCDGAVASGLVIATYLLSLLSLPLLFLTSL